MSKDVETCQKTGMYKTENTLKRIDSHQNTSKYVKIMRKTVNHISFIEKCKPLIFKQNMSSMRLLVSAAT